MTGRALPIAVAVSFLAASPSFAEVLNCGPVLNLAVDVPIPASVIGENALVSRAGSATSLALLFDHDASVAIRWMPNAYIGLGDSVRSCAANGCDAFIYVASNGIGAVSTPLRIDGTSRLLAWDYTPDLPPEPVWLRAFVERLIGPAQQVLAIVYSVSAMVAIGWADLGVVEPPATEENRQRLLDYWLSIGPDFITIPFYAMSELARQIPYECR